MDDDEARRRLADVPGWHLAGPPARLERRFTFPDFMQAQAFAVAVGAVSEAAGHHPDLCYGWGYCTVGYWTHKISGLHDNDFIMAAKVARVHDTMNGAVPDSGGDHA